MVKSDIYLNPYFSNVPILTIKMFVLMCPYVCIDIYSFSPITIGDGAEKLKQIVVCISFRCACLIYSLLLALNCWTVIEFPIHHFSFNKSVIHNVFGPYRASIHATETFAKQQLWAIRFWSSLYLLLMKYDTLFNSMWRDCYIKYINAYDFFYYLFNVFVSEWKLNPSS